MKNLQFTGKYCGFQFLMVQLKGAIEERNIVKKEFQFLMVQLKGGKGGEGTGKASFQFLMVQLKECATRIR